MSQQIPLRFPVQSLGFEDLIISSANRAMISAIRNTERWPMPVFCLIGPSASGLTTLLRAWAAERSADYIDVEAMNTGRRAGLEPDGQTAFSMQTADRALDRADLLENTADLLLAISAAQRNRRVILLSARISPGQWPQASADLISRLKSAPLQTMQPPDEALLRGRLRHGFARSYLHLSRNVEDYLVSRMALDYSEIEQAIDKLAGAAADRPVTIPVAREVLGLSDTEDAYIPEE